MRRIQSTSHIQGSSRRLLQRSLWPNPLSGTLSAGAGKRAANSSTKVLVTGPTDNRPEATTLGISPLVRSPVLSGPSWADHVTSSELQRPELIRVATYAIQVYFLSANYYRCLLPASMEAGAASGFQPVFACRSRELCPKYPYWAVAAAAEPFPARQRQSPCRT